MGFAFLASLPAKSRGTEPAPVHQARGGDKLWIDGNLDGYGVLFPHAEHEKRLISGLFFSRAFCMWQPMHRRCMASA